MNTIDTLDTLDTRIPLTALQVMQDAPVIPVIVLDDLAHAVPLAQAMLAGGIRMLEVTLRTPQALACIETIARHVPGAVVGAGTVRCPVDAQSAARAGARFAVSPGYTSALGQACRDAGLALLPGVASAGDIMRVQDDGWSEMKFFPAVQAGGIAMLRALGGPFFDVKFCPTGGINLQNASDFLALPNVVCVGGSWLVSPHTLASGDWDCVTRLAREACALRPSV